MAGVKGTVRVREIGDCETVLAFDVGRAGGVREFGVRRRCVDSGVKEPLGERRGAGVRGERRRGELRRRIPRPGVALAPLNMVLCQVGVEVRVTHRWQAIRRAQHVALVSSLFHCAQADCHSQAVATLGTA